MGAGYGTVMSRGLAVIGALPVVWFVGFSLFKELPRLLVDDPCFVWGQKNTATLSVAISVPLMLSGLGMITLLCGSLFLPSCYWTRAPRRS
jgi:hypothetical protein